MGPHANHFSVPLRMKRLERFRRHPEHVARIAETRQTPRQQTSHPLAPEPLAAAHAPSGQCQESLHTTEQRLGYFHTGRLQELSD